MKGWPNRRRLLWGRRSRIKILALPAVLLFIVVLVTGFHFTHSFSSSDIAAPAKNAVLNSAEMIRENSKDPGTLANNRSTIQNSSHRDMLRVTAVEPAFTVIINSTAPSNESATSAELRNTGQEVLTRIKIRDQSGEVLAIISQLNPGESKSISIKRELEWANATALDSFCTEVVGSIQYLRPSFPVSSAVDKPSTEMSFRSSSSGYYETSDDSSPADNEPKLETKDYLNSSNSISDISKVDAGISISRMQDLRKSSKVNLTIKTNRSEGYSGDVILFQCTAENSGNEELSDIELCCGQKKRSTTYLIPGSKIHLNGSFMLHNNTKLNATAKGKDPRGGNWTAQASTAVWMISPQMRIEAYADSGPVHRGDTIPLKAAVENIGQDGLFNLSFSDSLGHICSESALDPGQKMTLEWNRTLNESIFDQIKAVAYDSSGEDIYGSTNLTLSVLESNLTLDVSPEEALVYPGQPVKAVWILNNTGEVELRNITLTGEPSSSYRLKELSAGSSVRMCTIYLQNETSRINLSAKGYDKKGYAVSDSGSFLIRTINPGIGLKITPPEIEARAGDDINITCLVTNNGDDLLSNLILHLGNDVLATKEELGTGDFAIFTPRIKITSNSTLHFKAEATDSLGRLWSDQSKVRAKLVTSAIKLSAKAAPKFIMPGEMSKITCTVDNPGSVPLYDIFVISKAFGPLGIIEYLAPGHKKTISSDQAVNADLVDEITVEGHTDEKIPVIDSCNLHIAAQILLSPTKTASSSVHADKPVQSNKRIAHEDKNPIQARSDGTLTNTSSRNATAGYSKINKNIIEKNRSKEGSPIEDRAIKPSLKTADSSVAETGNLVIDEISGLIRYIKSMLEQMGRRAESVSKDNMNHSSIEQKGIAPSQNYELAIESAKGGDHGQIKILDVSAHPSHPPAGTPVKLTVHARSERGIKSSAVKWGAAEGILTRQEMLTVSRMFQIPMTLESGDKKDGYWSCTIPGRAAGSHMVLSVALTDGVASADDGPYMLHWSTVIPPSPEPSSKASGKSDGQEMLFIESSVVKGTGEVSIKDSFDDSTISFSERMKGKGSINLETLRCLDKDNPMVNFTQRRDLVFEGGLLKGTKSLESPAFHGGMGASITERFNLSHVKKTEIEMIRSLNRSDNTLALNTEQAFNGTWNIQTQYSQFFKKIKGDQQYNGSFQTQKNIKFQDKGKKL